MSETNDYWLARWREGQIGFHEDAPNAWLAENVGVLGPAEGRRVLVPLCGKSIDLAFLAAHGWSVVGVELSPLAAEAFFAEADLTPTRTENRLAANGIEIVVGDFFAFDAPPFDALYDRAATIALAPDVRRAYARKVDALLHAEARRLLVSYEHDGDPSTPPYSVDAAEIARLWPQLVVTPLGGSDTPADRVVKAGATFARTRTYLLTDQ